MKSVAPCWPISQTSLPSGPMLRIVAKMSTSSEVLDTHTPSTIGPVTSVSSSSGAVTNEMPVRSTLPAAFEGAEELTPACEGGLAAYVEVDTSFGDEDVSSPSASPLLLCSCALHLRYIFVQRVRA